MGNKSKSGSRNEAKRRKLNVESLNDPLPPPKPKPPKKKTLYSGMTPPIPPPALLDLVHRFLQDFKYVKAAHGVRTDNQKREGHKMAIWKGASGSLPDLLTLFLQWEQQNPELASVAPPNDSMSQKNEVLGFVEDAKGDRKLKEKERSSSDSTSSSGSDSNGEGDEAKSNIKVGVSGNNAAQTTTTGLKRKASEISQSESTSSTSSDSDSGSESDSNSEEKGGQSASASLSESSPSEADDKAKASKTPDVAETSLRSGSASSSSSEDDNSDSSEEVQTTAITPATLGSSEAVRRNGSDSSSTLPPPESQATKTQRRASSGSESSSSSDSDDETAPRPKSATNPTTMAPVIVPAGRQFSKPEVLVYNAPLSKRAKARGETLGEQKVVEATAQNFKMLKKQRVPYSRIPTDLVVDERFASNAYQPYDYANKAYQDLSITKGKGFTKAKQKGKRGSYRGGLIDTSGGRGIKFDD